MSDQEIMRVRFMAGPMKWRYWPGVTNETYEKQDTRVHLFARAGIYTSDQRVDPFQLMENDDYGNSYGWTWFLKPITGQRDIVFNVSMGGMGTGSGAPNQDHTPRIYAVEATFSVYFISTNWLPSYGNSIDSSDGSGTWDNEFVTPGSINFTNQPDVTNDPHISWKYSGTITGTNSASNTFSTWARFRPDGKTYYGLHYRVESCPSARKYSVTEDNDPFDDQIVWFIDGAGIGTALASDTNPDGSNGGTGSLVYAL